VHDFTSRSPRKRRSYGCGRPGGQGQDCLRNLSHLVHHLEQVSKLAGRGTGRASSAQQGSGGGGELELLRCAGGHRRQAGKHAVSPAGGAFQLVQMAAEVRWAEEAREPYEDVLAGADRQRGEGVLRVLGLQARQRLGAGVAEYRTSLAVEEVRERLVERVIAVVERHQDA